MWTKKKVPLFLIFTGLCFSTYAGYLVGGAWEEGADITIFMKNINKVMEAPFANYFNSFTVSAIFIAWSIYGIAILMYLTSRKNYRFGHEHGSAQFGDAGKITKQLADKKKENNRILSQNLQMSMDTRRTRLNNNILVIGGSGAGKTLFIVKPNIMQMNKGNSYICTDPKGELLAGTGSFLKDHGYIIKVLNLVEMEQSNHYNPFHYIRSETDVIKLITNLIANTTPKGSSPSDPFWEKAESLYLQSLFYYVWMEEPKEKRNFNTVLSLLAEAEVRADGKPSKLDQRMAFLEKTSERGANHPAVKQYHKCVRGAGDTVRSIIISANSRLAFLENEKVKKILADDEMDLASIGIGRNGDQRTRTALFCIIPDSDKSYNFIVGLLYSQLIQELYYQADFNYNGRLPIHVSLYLDEFSNVALPDDFCSLLSTMRSREISSIIIIQNMAQIKALFKDTWETVSGNCDALIYLGGNEQGSHKYMSEMLGKETIDKRSSGESRGKNGSSSRNFDVLGRELFTPDEIRKISNKKCLVLIRGFDPVLDDKYNTFKHPVFKESADGKGKRYLHLPDQHEKISRINQTPSFELLSKESLSYFEVCKERGENVIITSIDMRTLLSEQEEVSKEPWFSQEELEQNKKDIMEEAATEEGKAEEGKTEEKYSIYGKKELPDIFVQDEEPIWESENIENTAVSKGKLQQRLSDHTYTAEQLEQLEFGLESGLTEEQILEYFNPEYSAQSMKEIRESIEQLL